MTGVRTMIENTIDFNSHAHEGRDYKPAVSGKAFMNFNSHAHEGRDSYIFTAGEILDISTHTPTRGVTMCVNVLT